MLVHPCWRWRCHDELTIMKCIWITHCLCFYAKENLPSAPNPLRRLCSLAQTSLPCIPLQTVREVLLFCSAISTRGRQRWNVPWISSSVRANVSDLLPSSFPVLREPGRAVPLHSSVVSRRVGLFLSLSLLSLSPVTASHTQITSPHLSFQGRTRKDTLDWKLAFLMETICATLQREMVSTFMGKENESSPHFLQFSFSLNFCLFIGIFFKYIASITVVLVFWNSCFYLYIYIYLFYLYKIHILFVVVVVDWNNYWNKMFKLLLFAKDRPNNIFLLKI